MNVDELQQITFDVQDKVALVTLNRPDQMNTWTPIMSRDLSDAMYECDENDNIRAVVITGAGRAFCAGADLSGGEDGFTERTEIKRPPMWPYQVRKPVIAAINGAAVGIGATMQLPMDWRMAAEDSRYGFVFSRRGVTPEACSGWFLPRIVGMAKALDWTFSGRVFGAREALEAGLVQSLHASDALLDAAKEKALEMTSASAPVSVALARQLMWQGQTMAHPMDMHRVDSRVFASRGRSADVREGIAAFREKRDARYPDTVSTAMPDMGWAEEPPFA